MIELSSAVLLAINCFCKQLAQARFMSIFAGCMAALEAEHFLQEHDIQQGKAEPTTAENEALPDNGLAPPEHRPV